MFFDWGNRKPSKMPKTQPQLQPCPAPAEPGPVDGTDIPDLRAVLLELSTDRAHLRRNQSLFQKEMERFESVLEPLPAWLVTMYNLTSARRRDVALFWAKRLRLTQAIDENGQFWLELTERGCKWLSSPLENQYAFVYQRLRDKDVPSDDEIHWGHDYDDGWFLGAPVSVTPVSPGRHRRPSWGEPLTKEQRQPLRDALYAAFTKLPIGVFHRFDNFASHTCYGLDNPLLLGRQSDEVLVQVSGRFLNPREEPRYNTGYRLLGQFVSNRLVSLGCLQAGRDADGELMISRRPRFDLYFGHERLDRTNADSLPTVQTRVVVQPDFSVLVIGLDQSPLVELLPFCERIRDQSGVGTATLRITRASVVRGTLIGLSCVEILERLQRHSRTPLPNNVVHEVRDWSGWVRTASAEPATLIRCPDSAAADRVVAALSRRAVRLNETTVALLGATLSHTHRRKLLEQGIVLSRDDKDAGEVS